MQTLQEWINSNKNDDNAIYKKAFWNQVFWVRDTLACRIALDHDFQIYVSNTHTSKSILLPVYHVTIQGRVFEFRGNFYDWCLVGDADIDNEIPKYIRKEFQEGFYEGITLDSEFMCCVGTKEEFFMALKWVIHEGYNS